MKSFLLQNFSIEILSDFWVAALMAKRNFCYMSTCQIKAWIHFFLVSTILSFLEEMATDG